MALSTALGRGLLRQFTGRDAMLARAAWTSMPPRFSSASTAEEGQEDPAEVEKRQQEEAEAHKGKVKEFASHRRSFRDEMREVRKRFAVEQAKDEAARAKSAMADTEAVAAARQARSEARKAKKEENIARHEAEALAAKEAWALLREEKRGRRLASIERIEEGQQLRREVLEHYSRAWIREEELEDRIMLALKYPDRLDKVR